MTVPFKVDPRQVGEATKNAISLVREATRSNRSLSLMSGITAAGAVASAVLAMLGSPEMAVFGVAFVIAFTFVLLVFVSTRGTTNRSRKILAETLAWSFSLMMVAGIAALGSSFFACWPAPFGRQCQEKPSQHVTADAYQLDEAGMRMSGPDYFLDRAVRKSYEEVGYNPAAPTEVAFPVVSVIHGYSVKPDGKIEVTVTLLAGRNPEHLTVVRTVSLNDPQQWRSLKMSKSYPGGPDAAVAALEGQHIAVGKDGIVIFWSLSCFELDEVLAKQTYFQILVEDAVTKTYNPPSVMPVRFVPRENTKGLGCPNPSSPKEATDNHPDAAG